MCELIFFNSVAGTYIYTVLYTLLVRYQNIYTCTVYSRTEHRYSTPKYVQWIWEILDEKSKMSSSHCTYGIIHVQFMLYLRSRSLTSMYQSTYIFPVWILPGTGLLVQVFNEDDILPLSLWSPNILNIQVYKC